MVLAVVSGAGPVSAETWDAPRMEKAGKLYLLKCTKCHKLHDPVDYDDAAWAKWMKKMKRKARLNEDQYEQISRYAESLRKG